VERELRWDACWNVRDLGGYGTLSGRRTDWKSIIRAGNLSRLTTAGRDALIAYGIRTVIDLRDPREFAVELDPFHERGVWAGQVTYVSEPLISEAEWAAIRDPEVMKKGYVVTFELSRPNIARVMSAIAAAPPGGVVVHCHAGKERTGVVAALLLALAGVPDEVIAEDYVASDRYLGPLYAEWAAREEDPDERSRRLRGFTSKPAHMLQPLEHLRTRGGVAAYLSDGLSVHELMALRERLCGH
jgi:protein-tyrosine phosphatase